MTGRNWTRRDISLLAGATAFAAPVVARAAAGAPRDARPATEREISHSEAAIHQEIDFTASAAHLYSALTTTQEFDKVVQLSLAMNSNMKAKLGALPTAIDAEPGGAFVLFGGYVTGRFLELVPDLRIVQAWRAGSWSPGNYSIVRFEFRGERAGTRLIFDHAGFPSDAAAELAWGWHVNYWEPLAKSLA